MAPATAFPHPYCRAATETPELSALPHLGAPALAPECAERDAAAWRTPAVRPQHGGGVFMGIQIVYINEGIITHE